MFSKKALFRPSCQHIYQEFVINLPILLKVIFWCRPVIWGRDKSDRIIKTILLNPSNTCEKAPSQSNLKGDGRFWVKLGEERRVNSIPAFVQIIHTPKKQSFLKLKKYNIWQESLATLCRTFFYVSNKKYNKNYGNRTKYCRCYWFMNWDSLNLNILNLEITLICLEKINMLAINHRKFAQ